MPELPEVEVIRSRLQEKLAGQRLQSMTARSPRLRYPIHTIDTLSYPEPLLRCISRRAKYMLWEFDHGNYLLHLGMSGRVRLCDMDEPWQAHEHIQWDFEQVSLRLIDPRRFGCWIQQTAAWAVKLQALGPDALSCDFSEWYAKHRHSKRGLYALLMDQNCLSGVGNIYAQEALFQSRLHPEQPISRTSQSVIVSLGENLQNILKRAIAAGGSTLNDHRQLDGSSGYFQLTLMAYGRAGQPCLNCGRALEKIRLSQRTVAFCPSCQALG